MQILLYLLVFVGKMVEVSLATIRNVLVNRGEKLLAAVIGFFEVLLWVILVSNVLSTITDDPIKVVVYCLAFSCGNYVGVIIEDKLAIGNASLQAVVSCAQQEDLIKLLRDQGYGVTRMYGEGKDGEVGVVLVYLKRKLLNEAISLIRSQCPNAMITVNDIRQLHHGFLKK